MKKRKNEITRNKKEQKKNVLKDKGQYFREKIVVFWPLFFAVLFHFVLPASPTKMSPSSLLTFIAFPFETVFPRDT